MQNSMAFANECGPRVGVMHRKLPCRAKPTRHFLLGTPWSGPIAGRLATGGSSRVPPCPLTQVAGACAEAAAAGAADSGDTAGRAASAAAARKANPSLLFALYRIRLINA